MYRRTQPLLCPMADSRRGWGCWITVHRDYLFVASTIRGGGGGIKSSLSFQLHTVASDQASVAAGMCSFTTKLSNLLQLFCLIASPYVWSCLLIGPICWNKMTVLSRSPERWSGKVSILINYSEKKASHHTGRAFHRFSKEKIVACYDKRFAVCSMLG